MQLTYSDKPGAAVEGMLFDAAIARDIITGIAGAAIGFGRAVNRIAGAAEPELPPEVEVVNAAGDITGGIFRGFSINDPTYEQQAAAGYDEGTEVRILRHGRIWVWSEETVAVGDPVFARHASGAGGTILGRVRNDADTATCAQVPGAFFHSARTGAGLVVIEL